jgi:(2Fe-2S) ferredoxin
MARSCPAFRVLLCDGCCCGTERKHPDVDHAAQRSRLGHAARRGGGSVRTTGCLDRCSESNVIVVRRSDGPTTWLGRVLDQDAERAVAVWLSAGADPDTMSDIVQALVVSPPRPSLSSSLSSSPAAVR